MKKIFTFLGVLGLGTVIGWNSHALYAFFAIKTEVVPKQDEIAVLSPVATSSLQEVNVFDFFSNKNLNSSLLDNTQLGMVIELIKQDLDIDAKNKLNKEVVMYAKSLARKTAEGTEQRLLALLGNYDTRELVLDILARFYARKKEYKKAISSLYNLRSMTQFDSDYQKISSRINVLSQKNLKHLKAYNYKVEASDFFKFILEKEPDNFAIQMQYAEFEYDSRQYAHVEELLEILRYHPEYALKSEALLQKAKNQRDKIENGIIPVPVEKLGDHYVVSAVINNQEPVKLMIDTGASLTILSPRVIRNLGMRLDDVAQYRLFSTANGTVKAPVIVLDSLSVQNHLVTDLQVGVLPTSASTQFSGLLGMNFLSQFSFFIDQENSTLELVDAEP